MVLHPLQRVKGGGIWECTINIPPGTHQFKFLVDGAWELSSCFPVVDDNVGTTGNNWVQVAAPTLPSSAQDYDAEMCQAAIQALGAAGADGRDLQEFQDLYEKLKEQDSKLRERLAAKESELLEKDKR